MIHEPIAQNSRRRSLRSRGEKARTAARPDVGQVPTDLVRRPVVAAFGALLLLLAGCSDDPSTNEPPSDSPNRILPLGASRVEGARPDFESFRYELWIDLVEGGWEFDFVGTQSDNGRYPILEGNEFDDDHEGRGGYTSGEILEGIEGWLDETGAPDVVLFSSPGGNDILNGQTPLVDIVANIVEIIGILRSSNPEVTVILEELAPGRSDLMTDRLLGDFDAIRSAVRTIADERSTATSQVLTVDMETGFTDDMLADDVHYNEVGADFVATRYYDLLATVLDR
jgi:lysophospholipase L1-like esterase